MEKYIETFAAIPWLDVVVATLVMFAWSSLWYGKLFHQSYVFLSGKNPEETKPSGKQCALGIIPMFLTATLIGLIDVHANGHPVAIFASVILVWVFISLDTVHATIWDRMPFKLFLIHSFSTLTNFLFAGLVFYHL